MKAPIEPNKEDCCNSGCNPCIFDVYEKQLKLYQRFLISGDIENNSTENAISQLDYTEFILTKNVQICDSHVQLYFKRLHDDELQIWWRDGDHFLLKFKSEHTTCTRAYTPIKCDTNVNNYDFSIIVKVYTNGLVSNYLNNLKPGNSTLWRGPYGSFKYVVNQFERIVFIVQGTGIVAIINTVDKILNNDDDITKIVLYYCCQKEDVILFRDKLYSYKSYWNFKYKIFISNHTPTSCYKYQEPIVQKKLTKEDVLTLRPVKSKDQILLCGSPEFMKSYQTFLKEEVNSDLDILLF